MTGASAILKDIQSKMHNVRYACDKLRDIDKNLQRTINQKQAYKEHLQKELEDASYGDAMAIGAVTTAHHKSAMRSLIVKLINELE